MTILIFPLSTQFLQHLSNFYYSFYYNKLAQTESKYSNRLRAFGAVTSPKLVPRVLSLPLSLQLVMCLHDNQTRTLACPEPIFFLCILWQRYFSFNFYLPYSLQLTRFYLINLRPGALSKLLWANVSREILTSSRFTQIVSLLWYMCSWSKRFVFKVFLGHFPVLVYGVVLI